MSLELAKIIRSAVAVVAAALPLSAAAAPAEPQRVFGIVVVRDGAATAAQLGQVRAAVRAGLLAGDAKLADDMTVLELMRSADAATGECDKDCESRMRSEFRGNVLVLARLSTSVAHFALRVSDDEDEFSAAGALLDLAPAAKRIGSQLGSRVGSLIVTGIPEGTPVFVDGKRIELKNGVVQLARGPHILRIRDGLGRHALARVEVFGGEAVAFDFATGESRVVVTVPQVASARSGPVLRPPQQRAAQKNVSRISGGVAMIARQYDFSSASGAGFQTQFFGTGPLIAASLERGTVVFDGHLSSISYFSKARFELEDGTNAVANGGSSVSVHVASGRTFRIGTSAVKVTPQLGFFLESHDAGKARGPEGTRVFTGYRRLGLNAHVRGELLAAKLRLRAEIGASPWSSLHESSSMLGSSARSSVAPYWSIGVDARVRGSWTAQIEYAGTVWSAEHSGDAMVNMNPPIQDVRVEQFFNVVSLELRRGF